MGKKTTSLTSRKKPLENPNKLKGNINALTGANMLVTKKLYKLFKSKMDIEYGLPANKSFEILMEAVMEGKIPIEDLVEDYKIKNNL